VYEELRKLAYARMAAESLDHTLQPTALVHEAYLRLVKSNGSGPWNGRGHFFSAAAEAMRRILVDCARNKKRLKRGGEARKQQLEPLGLFWKPQFGGILELDEALDGLADIDPQVAELVKLRCFTGLTHAEAAALLGISLATAKRNWTFARAWLYRALNPDDSIS
jgi:RNA polymerase sigma factor (TIGR02999 family)